MVTGLLMGKLLMLPGETLFDCNEMLRVAGNLVGIVGGRVMVLCKSWIDNSLNVEVEKGMERVKVAHEY